MLTKVYDLSASGMPVAAEYDLPPEQAVRNAYAQLGRNDWNTWEYQKYDRFVYKGKVSVSCGNYSAWIQTEEVEKPL